jgi:hypothetical protein
MPYVLNGQPVNLAEEPVFRDGATYVPLNAVASALGGSVGWDNDTKTASATIGNWTANVQMMNNTVDVNGTAVSLSAPPIVENDTMYVPWELFRDAYGYKASYDGNTLTIGL